MQNVCHHHDMIVSVHDDGHNEFMYFISMDRVLFSLFLSCWQNTTATTSAKQIKKSSNQTFSQHTCDTFTRTSARESKINAVARAQLTFQIITWLLKHIRIINCTMGFIVLTNKCVFARLSFLNSHSSWSVSKGCVVPKMTEINLLSFVNLLSEPLMIQCWYAIWRH